MRRGADDRGKRGESNWQRGEVRGQSIPTRIVLKTVQFFYCAIILLHGFVQYAQFTKPADALALLEALPDPGPFETLMDTFRARVNRKRLNRLAAERRAEVVELLKRLDGAEKAGLAQAADPSNQE